MVWSGDPEIFRVGGLSLRWYGLLFALGFVIGFQIMRRIFRKENKSEEILDRMLFYMIVGTVVGARLGHCLFYEPQVYLADPLRILKVWEGGLASHGAVLGIITSMYLFARKYGFTFLWIMDRVCVAVALGSFFIRVGNFFNSEIVGKPTDVPWAVTFARIDSFPRHPAQLYEALVYLTMFFILWNLYQKEKIRRAEGFIFGLLLTVFFSSRILIEFVKENQVAFESTLPLNMGQILSIPVVLYGLFLMYRAWSQPHTHRRTSSPKK